MDRETIIKLAREAGFELSSLGMTYTSGSLPELLEHFAKLVAEHIRETEFTPDWNNYHEGRKHGADEEREACAKVCDELDNWYTPKACASRIRSRGQ